MCIAESKCGKKKGKKDLIIVPLLVFFTIYWIQLVSATHFYIPWYCITAYFTSVNKWQLMQQFNLINTSHRTTYLLILKKSMMHQTCQINSTKLKMLHTIPIVDNTWWFNTESEPTPWTEFFFSLPPQQSVYQSNQEFLSLACIDGFPS